jgi:hypothetical protein
MFSRAFFLLLALLPVGLQAQQPRQQNECELDRFQVCLVHILQDEAGIVTSPARMRPSDLLWIAPFGLATGVAIDYDAHALRSLGNHPQR